ncbi:hypothetical protein K1T71_006268 [Dendrolimus kikuchii]|uniref:Uncharacterized protein n=1 Tax=Dendrolimus kikuchii TaxID=765133 RepID=A0ACC1D3U3_9NEOP|nr:hypothetical protein K1T71_006268 [Dendrolimus kikuchii]
MEDLKKLRAARGYVKSALNTYTLRAYQLDRDARMDPTVPDFLSYLDNRALALESAESPSSSEQTSGHDKSYECQRST